MINFKRGDTFAPPLCTFWLNKSLNQRQDLTNVTIRCMVRKGSTLVDNLVVTVVSAVDGTFKLRSSGPTTNWPIATLTSDIEFTWTADGTILSTETFQIACVKDETYGE